MPDVQDRNKEVAEVVEVEVVEEEVAEEEEEDHQVHPTSMFLNNLLNQRKM